MMGKQEEPLSTSGFVGWPQWPDNEDYSFEFIRVLVTATEGAQIGLLYVSLLEIEIIIIIYFTGWRSQRKIQERQASSADIRRKILTSLRFGR
jgi:hypothetical protein